MNSLEHSPQNYHFPDCPAIKTTIIFSAAARILGRSPLKAPGTGTLFPAKGWVRYDATSAPNSFHPLRQQERKGENGLHFTFSPLAKNSIFSRLNNNAHGYQNRTMGLPNLWHGGGAGTRNPLPQLWCQPPQRRTVLPPP
jgi:hypothetical protein